ncbi:MAG: methyltransferase domain-containing protein [Elusimicrobia bacterium]|nr:methyltransferase domain-containing protein [Elusimicrobiota bacterium]
MTTPPVFSKEYAADYDVVYAKQDYTGECALVERTLQRYGKAKIKTILDLGCGTGTHSLLLANRGYEVTGVDRSESMITQARTKKPNDRSMPVTFQQGDAATLNLGRSFDAVLMMSAVLDYQLENQDVVAALQTVKRHLNPNGLFLFDVWNGPAVLKTRPQERIRIFESHGQKLIRLAVPKLDSTLHRCTIEYRHLLLQPDHQYRETVERHTVRYFFPMEVKQYLAETGFELVSMAPLPEGEGSVTDDHWHVSYVARNLEQR